jgi:hypothetical protein
MLELILLQRYHCTIASVSVRDRYVFPCNIYRYYVFAKD